MSRHAFWTIIVGGTPTAFRAPLREDLLPTLVQLQRKDPDAVIRWFEKGQLWETPGHAQDAFTAKREEARPRRGPTWRPGGDHKDPRDKYKQPRDVKRKKWASQAAEGRGPWVKKDGRTGGREDGRTGGAAHATGGRRPTPDRRPAAHAATPPVPGRTPAPRGDRRPAQGTRPTGGPRPAAAGGKPAPRGDRRPAGGDRRPSSGDRRPATDNRRPPSASSRPPSTGRPPRPPGTPSAPPSAASAKRKPNVFRAGELPPKRKKREDE